MNYERAAAGGLDGWKSAPRTLLALVLLLDQFPRNMFRGTPRAFATDRKALVFAKFAVGKGFDLALEPIESVFFYLPFQHSENLDDQCESVRLHHRLAAQDTAMAGYLSYAEQHMEVIRCFGRFPHRNTILNRPSTPAEAQFIASGVLPR